MARHAAVVGRWRSLRLSFGGLVRAGAAGFAIVAGTVLVFSAWDERHVLGQPDEHAVVRATVPAGRFGSGRSSCPGADVQLVVATPRPDLPDRTARLRACDGEYRTGEEVLVRRVPGHPEQTYDAPLGLVGLAGLAVVLGGVAGVLTAAGAVVSGLWEERSRPRWSLPRQLRRRDPPRRRRFQWLGRLRRGGGGPRHGW